MLLQGNQGQTGKAVGQGQTLGFGEYTDALVSELMPRYYEQTYRGNTFVAANQAAVTSTTALTASSLNFTLFNPLGSGKNLVLLKIDMTVLPVTETTAGLAEVVLVANVAPSQAAPATVTALTPICTLLGSSANPVGKAYSTATLAAVPTVIKALATIISPTAVGGAAVIAPSLNFDLEGGVIITPGNYVSVQSISTTETTAPGLLCSMKWMEIPQ